MAFFHIKTITETLTMIHNSASALSTPLLLPLAFISYFLLIYDNVLKLIASNYIIHTIIYIIHNISVKAMTMNFFLYFSPMGIHFLYTCRETLLCTLIIMLEINLRNQQRGWCLSHPPLLHTTNLSFRQTKESL